MAERRETEAWVVAEETNRQGDGEGKASQGMTPVGGTVVAGNAMVSLRPMGDGTGYDYDIAIFHATDSGEISIEYMASGQAIGMPSDGDGLALALAAALPDGLADKATLVSDGGCALDGATEADIAEALGYGSAQELGTAMHRASCLTAGCEPNSIGRGSYIPDADGHPISIGSWIRQWDDAPVHLVVGVGLNRFHGPMVMVDDAVTGEWLCVTRGTRVIDGISDWEGLIDAAERKLLPRDELVRMARFLAMRDEE